MSLASQAGLLATRIGQECKALWTAVNAKVSTSDPRIAASGNVPWTPVGFAGGVAQISANRFAKATGTPNWDGYFYSQEGFVDSAEVGFSLDHTDIRFMMGLTADPTAVGNYSIIDYAWYVDGVANQWSIYENNASVFTVAISPATTDYAQITFDGANVRYYLNGVLRRTVARAIGADLHLVASFYDVAPTGVKAVRFDSGPGGGNASALAAGTVPPARMTGFTYRQTYTAALPARVTPNAGAPFVTWVGPIDPAANMLAGDDWISTA